MAGSARWGTKRKERKKETKKRAQRAKESAPRKKRVTKLLPIAAKGDIEGLARQRKRVSVVKRRSRLVELNNDQLEEYADRAGVTLRTAQRDRGPKLHPGRLSDKQQEQVWDLWARMVNESGEHIEGHKICTIANFIKQAWREFAIKLSSSQAGRIVIASGVRKPKSTKNQPSNDPGMLSHHYNRV